MCLYIYVQRGILCYIFCTPELLLCITKSFKYVTASNVQMAFKCKQVCMYVCKGGINSIYNKQYARIILNKTDHSVQIKQPNIILSAEVFSYRLYFTKMQIARITIGAILKNTVSSLKDIKVTHINFNKLTDSKREVFHFHYELNFHMKIFNCKRTRQICFLLNLDTLFNQW